jgi:TolB-like protein/DNA-binding winged helix-turn-helix (wHTH) protein/Tfp pilus assembly protein PilF
MSSGENSRFLIRFDVFEVDLKTGELRRRGLKVRLRDQSFQVLAMLLERPGQLVSREELQRRLWSTDTFVDFDRGLNKAINRLRDALGDSAKAPIFIETLPKRGYRFVGSVEDDRVGGIVPLSAAPVETPIEPRFEPDPLPTTFGAVRSRARTRRLGFTAVLVAVLVAQTSSRASRAHTPYFHGGGRIMLAVLPFENLTGDREQEYLSDGITEEMITRLGQLEPEQLGVIARTSVMGYKHSNHLSQIAQELRVQYAIEGSVRRNTRQLRVTVQMIRLKDQTPLWSAIYDRNAEDILRLQSQIAKAVADAIQSKLASEKRTQEDSPPLLNADAASIYSDGHGKERLLKDYTQSEEAHKLYLKGRYFWNERSGEGYRRAIGYFRQAIDKDPDYALAYAGLADCYLLMGGYNSLSPKEAIPLAVAAAREAIEIDPGLAQPHASLALIAQNYEWDWSKASKEYLRALALNPNYSTAHHWYGEFMGLMGKADRGLQELERAHQLDPLSAIISTDVCKVLYHARRYDEAIEQCRKTLQLHPEFVMAWQWIGLVYRKKGMLAEAVNAVEKAAELEPSPVTRSEAAIYRASTQSRAAALQEVDRMGRLWKQSSVTAYNVAYQYAWFGKNDLAFEWLKKSVEERSPWVVGFHVIPTVDPIRSDPRYVALVRRLGLDRINME